MARASGAIRAVLNPNKNNVTNPDAIANGLISQSGVLGSTSNPPVDAIVIAGAANASAANLLIVTNASMGQATTVTIPDPGMATASFVLSNAGLVSSIMITLNTAAVTGAYAAPAVLIAAPGAGKTIIIQEATIYTASTGNTAYATGTAPVIQYDTTVHGAGTAATSAIAAGDLTAASSQVKALTSPTGALTGITNKGIYFSNATGAYTAGTGTNIVITLTYQVLTATV